MFLRGPRAVFSFSGVVVLVALSLSLVASHQILGQLLGQSETAANKVNPPESVETSTPDTPSPAVVETIPVPESVEITPTEPQPTPPPPSQNTRATPQLPHTVTPKSVSSKGKTSSSAEPVKKQIPPCGNGWKDLKEQCDRGRWNGFGDCGKDCQWLRCGDGILSRQIGEECEPKRVKTAGASSAMFEEEPSCGIVCVDPQKDKKPPLYGGCYWKFLDSCPAPEESTLALQGSALKESYLDAAPTTSVDDPDAPIAEEVIIGECGNGIKEQDEECDEASDNTDDVPDACRTNCLTPRCGDGVIDGSEECDGDEDCSDLCEWTTDEPLVLDPYGDIDAVIKAAESALDGVTDNGSIVREELCGNTLIEGEEECDDGNDIDEDGCSILCEIDVFHAAPGADESVDASHTPVPLWAVVGGIVAAAAALGQWVIRRKRESIVVSDEI